MATKKGRSKEKSESEKLESRVEKPKFIAVPRIEAALSVLGVDRYLSRKEIPKSHHTAMKAFTDVTVATWEQWEDIFKGY